MDSLKKTILMLQPSQLQGKIWQAALASQGFLTIWESGTVDLAQMLDQIQQAKLSPPDLVLIDVGALDVNPYAFCRWCRENYPDQKIILTNANQKEISLPERHWAVYQGAQDLLPAFQQSTLLSGMITAVTRVIEVVGWKPLQQEPLVQVLTSLSLVTESTEPKDFFNSFGSDLYSQPLTNIQDLSGVQPQPSPPVIQPAPPTPQPIAPERVVEPETNKDASGKPPKRRSYRGVTY
ncbi:MAG: response regulator [Leptolyngbyaceae bacterium]|nr:response regulator [Leptolyngbyaceae bacterium]